MRAVGSASADALPAGDSAKLLARGSDVCSDAGATTAAADTPAASADTPPLPVVTLELLARHNSRESAWIAIRGVVYDATAYLRYHPGGSEQLMRGVGGEATDMFLFMHPWLASTGVSVSLAGRAAAAPSPSQSMHA
jgi:cytochrome b involved in lipid metabolism